MNVLKPLGMHPVIRYKRCLILLYNSKEEVMKRFFATVAEQAAKQTVKKANLIQVDKKFAASYAEMIHQAKLKLNNNPEYKELVKKTDSKKLDEALEEINKNFKTFSAY